MIQLLSALGIFLLPLTILAQETLDTKLKFSHESEASIIATGGNSELETYNFDMSNKLAKNKNEVTFGGHYTYGTANQVASARNWDINLRYDRLATVKYSYFFGEQMEGDKFSGHDYRLNTDIGANYKFLNHEKTKLHFEVGYRYFYEKRLNGEIRRNNKARLFLKWSKEINENLTAKAWIEYTPNFTVSEDYMVKIEPSLVMTLTKIFSLKLAYHGEYDNQPATSGNKKYDYRYTTSLLANF